MLLRNLYFVFYTKERNTPKSLLAGADNSLSWCVTLLKPGTGFPHLLLRNSCLSSSNEQLAAAFQLSSHAPGGCFSPEAPAKVRGGKWEGSGTLQ